MKNHNSKQKAFAFLSVAGILLIVVLFAACPNAAQNNAETTPSPIEGVWAMGAPTSGANGSTQQWLRCFYRGTCYTVIKRTGSSIPAENGIFKHYITPYTFSNGELSLGGILYVGTFSGNTMNHKANVGGTPMNYTFEKVSFPTVQEIINAPVGT